MSDSDQLCHRCRRVPMVTTVSAGAREVALCLVCLRTVAEEALRVERYMVRPSEREAWKDALERVGE